MTPPTCKPCAGRRVQNKPAVRCVFCEEPLCFTHLADSKVHPCVEVQQKAQPKARG